MILVDTSVWINHFRKGDSALSSLLSKGKAAVHEFIIGELACGSFKNYKEIINLLKNLQRSPNVTFEECLSFIEKNKLYGKGIGFIDVNLLASAKLSDYPLFTYDKKLLKVAKELSLEFLD